MKVKSDHSFSFNFDPVTDQLKTLRKMTRCVSALAILALASTAWAYSGGAPESVCGDMVPKHPVEPQKSAFPYTVSVNKKEVKGGETVSITVGGQSFKGFLIQVRDGDKAVGSFNIPDSDKFSKTINCHGHNKSGATHKNSSEKKSITLTWTAPNTKANLKVYATVAQDGGTFWVRQPTQSIKVN